MEFIIKNIPNLGEFLVPEDVILRLPSGLTIDKKDWHYLVSIPWEDKYISNVPDDFKDFFKFVLPYLSARTTNVHVATCLGYLDQLITEFPGEEINRRVVGLSLILHDIGWSQLSDQEIANSLGVSGLKLTDLAMAPKEKHAIKSERLARKLLGDSENGREPSEDSDSEVGKEVGEKVNGEFKFEPRLSNEEKEIIFKAVRYHDKPEEVAGASEVPIEVKLLVDLDHIWSFIYEDFWLDTIRKGVDPHDYLENLSNDLDSYFVTNPGKKLARKLLDERRVEVESIR